MKLDQLHEATHRIPGVPEHVDHPAGHQGRSNQPHHPRLTNPAREHASINHPARRPRVLIAWQRRIAAFFGQWI
jgi:hypothetical protein